MDDSVEPIKKPKRTPAQKSGVQYTKKDGPTNLTAEQS